MRLTRLVLGCYGHLTDLELVFPAEPGLHIVLGANEAGKSTALAAIGDCLFGFPHRTPFAFLHAQRDLRIGAGLRARDGRQTTFLRRKGRKEDLFDEHDRPQPESAIAAFLSGATRERFNRVFGLNGEELRRGGDAILKGEGEVGEAIMQAHTGLHGFRALVDRLDGEAGRLFGDRRGQREFHMALKRFTEAKQCLAERQIEPATYKQKQEEVARLEQARASNAERSLALHATRSRMDRIRRTTPARAALERALQNRSELGTVPPLPPDAAACHQGAVALRDRAQRDLQREQAREAELLAELAALMLDPTVLGEADTIDQLAADRNRIAGAERDRETQVVVAGQRAAAVTQWGRHLGLALDAEALASRIPNALDRDRVMRLLARHQRLVGERSKVEDDLAASQARLADAQAAMDRLAEPEPSVDLRQAIEAARAEGRLEADIAEVDRATRMAVAERAQALSSLPLWDRDASALAAMPIPLETVVQRHAEEVASHQQALRRIAARVVALDQTLVELAADAQADVAIGEPPTVEAIHAARGRRDRAWQLIRRHLAGGPAPSADEWQEAVGAGVVADGFETLLRGADHLADRRAAEQERVVAVEQRRANEFRQRTLLAAAEAERTAARASLEAAEQQWRALWLPAGVDPLEPAAMREWIQKRGTIVSLHNRVLDSEHRLSALRQRHADACAAFAFLLPQATSATAASGTEARLSVLLHAADRVCGDREDQEATLAEARRAKAAAIADGQKAAHALARIEAAVTGWAAEWAEIAPLLSLPPHASAEQATPALNAWNEIDAAVRARQDALNRIEEMRVTIDRFDCDAATLVARVAPGLETSDPHSAVAVLATRLSNARQAARRHNEVGVELAKVQAMIRQSMRDEQAAARALAELRAVAAVADDDALRQAISRAGAYQAFSGQIEDREAELRRLDDGKSPAELATEAEGVDVDALPGELARVEAEIRAISDDDLANQARRSVLKQELDAMEAGRGAAGAAQTMQTALADLDDIAARYVPLRMAHVLLRAGIDRFRRQQQDPLLNRAGHIFARLTEGRYDRLGVDEDDGKLLIKACRPDGTECSADRLSEGTLDQLYLALRLAAIESYARSTEPLPFIGDDLLVNFDDQRARAAIRVLAEFGRVTQTILFTHHGHIADMAEHGAASVHRLSPRQAALASPGDD